jgi:hypothetical protein
MAIAREVEARRVSMRLYLVVIGHHFSPIIPKTYLPSRRPVELNCPSGSFRGYSITGSVNIVAMNVNGSFSL